jgi:hypothetical protein
MIIAFVRLTAEDNDCANEIDIKEMGEIKVASGEIKPHRFTRESDRGHHPVDRRKTERRTYLHLQDNYIISGFQRLRGGSVLRVCRCSKGISPGGILG